MFNFSGIFTASSTLVGYEIPKTKVLIQKWPSSRILKCGRSYAWLQRLTSAHNYKLFSDPDDPY